MILKNAKRLLVGKKIYNFAVQKSTRPRSSMDRIEVS